jgi:hypothetical protein
MAVGLPLMVPQDVTCFAMATHLNIVAGLIDWIRTSLPAAAHLPLHLNLSTILGRLAGRLLDAISESLAISWLIMVITFALPWYLYLHCNHRGALYKPSTA